MIKRYLDICTSHLRKETLDGLQPDKWPYSYSYKEGVFITVCDDDDNFMADLPEDLQILIRYVWIEMRLRVRNFHDMTGLLCERQTQVIYA